MPATTTPPLPPVDPEADRLIGDLFNRYPEARYRITQLAFVQEHALTEAQNRIQRLEWELQQAQQAAQQAQQQQRSGSAAVSSAACSAAPARRRRQQGGPGPAWNQGQRTGSELPAGRATAATIRAELPAGHVPALGLRLPGFGADHRGRRRRRPGRRQCADEPVLRLARHGRRVRRRFGGGAAEAPGARRRARPTRAIRRTVPAPAGRGGSRAMSTTAPGTPRATISPRGPTTAAEAIPAGTRAAAALGRRFTDLTGGRLVLGDRASSCAGRTRLRQFRINLRNSAFAVKPVSLV